ncbi:MAG TPA: MmgE/PrpD family protein [Burkholderiales bacterium]|nr:MmgE/PrpD family protein [Burkholderiales bacterium]
MTAASTRLAEFALGLRYEDIPAQVVERAKVSLIDTVATSSFGAHLPWSRMVAQYAQRNSAAGEARILGTDLRVRAPFAALANGAQAHAFELDSLCQPSVGVHPGASLTAPALALGQELGASGRDVITAFVAGFEVMYRIGDAARHTSEHLGFHAPGLTGVFGAVIVGGRLLGLDAQRMAHALGIGGSMCSGLLEFSKSGGGMVKRLHLGRAAEGGLLAASLARDGFTGPAQVLEGKFGFLNVFARDTDPPRLTAGLGEVWHTEKAMLKRYACHITAHVPVTAALELKAKHGFAGTDIAQVTVAGQDKMVSHHNITEPEDIAMAQYSTPFCVAMALHRDPLDPRAFNDANLNDAAIRATCRNTRVVKIAESEQKNRFSSRVTVKLKDGRELETTAHDFEGMPHRPLTREALAAKFSRLTSGIPGMDPGRLLERLHGIEQVADVRALLD